MFPSSFLRLMVGIRALVFLLTKRATWLVHIILQPIATVVIVHMKAIQPLIIVMSGIASLLQQ